MANVEDVNSEDMTLDDDADQVPGVIDVHGIVLDEKRARADRIAANQMKSRFGVEKVMFADY